jgi:hypothetical protein
MGTTWVLDSETKGTGANMVPLERVVKKPSGAPERPRVPRKPRPPKREAPKSRQPRKFRVVDVMTRQIPADGVGARETVEALRGFRSIVDVDVYVWHPGGDRWRRLTFGEVSELWKLRETIAG